MSSYFCYHQSVIAEVGLRYFTIQLSLFDPESLTMFIGILLIKMQCILSLIGSLRGVPSLYSINRMSGHVPACY